MTFTTALKKKGLNEYQIESVLKYLEGNVVLTEDDILSFTYSEIKDKIIIPQNLANLTANFKNLIGDGKHATIQVTGLNGYSYSIGLCVNSPLDHELLVLGGHQLGDVFINQIVSQYPNANYPNEEFTLPGMYIEVNDNRELARFRINKAENSSAIINQHFAKIYQWTDKLPENIYLIEVTDKFNKFPNE